MSTVSEPRGGGEGMLGGKGMLGREGLPVSPAHDTQTERQASGRVILRNDARAMSILVPVM